MPVTIYPCLRVYQPSEYPHTPVVGQTPPNAGSSASALTLAGGSGCLRDPYDESTYLDWNSEAIYDATDVVYYYMDFGPVEIPEGALFTLHIRGIPHYHLGFGVTDPNAPYDGGLASQFFDMWDGDTIGNTNRAYGSAFVEWANPNYKPMWGQSVLFVRNFPAPDPSSDLFMEGYPKQGGGYQFGYRIYGAHLAVLTETIPADQTHIDGDYIHAAAGDAVGYPAVIFDQSGKRIGARAPTFGSYLPFKDGSWFMGNDGGSEGVTFSPEGDLPLAYSPLGYRSWFGSDRGTLVGYDKNDGTIVEYTQRGKLIRSTTATEAVYFTNFGDTSPGAAVKGNLYFCVDEDSYGGPIVKIDLDSGETTRITVTAGADSDDVGAFFQYFCVDHDETFYILWGMTNADYVGNDDGDSTYYSMEARITHHKNTGELLGAVEWYNKGGYGYFIRPWDSGVIARNSDLIFGGVIGGTQGVLESPDPEMGDEIDGLYIVKKSDIPSDGSRRQILFLANQYPELFAITGAQFEFAVGLVPLFPLGGNLDSVMNAVKVHFIKS